MSNSTEERARLVTTRLLRPGEEILAFTSTKTIGQMAAFMGPAFLAVTRARLIDTPEANWSPMSSRWEDIASMKVDRYGWKWIFEYQRVGQSTSYGVQIVSKQFASVMQGFVAGNVRTTVLEEDSTRGVLAADPMNGWGLADYARAQGYEDLKYVCESCESTVALVRNGEISPIGPACTGCHRTIVGYDAPSG